jgi:hypothetical protein
MFYPCLYVLFAPWLYGVLRTVSLDNCVDVMNAITEETPCTCEFFAQHDEGGGGCESHMECTFIGYLTGLWKACLQQSSSCAEDIHTGRSRRRCVHLDTCGNQADPFPCHRGRLFHATEDDSSMPPRCTVGNAGYPPRHVSCVQSKTVLHLMGQSCTWPEQLRTGQSTQSTASNGPS